MENKTFVELAEIYQAAIDELEKADIEIGKCLDAGDKSRAKSLECGMNQHIDTLFEVEEILYLRDDFC